MSAKFDGTVTTEKDDERKRKEITAKLAMTIDEALEFAAEWSKGLTLYEGAQGWRVVCMLLAEEVRKLRGAQNTEAVAEAADRLEVLEREHREFFERWHEERRKREALDLAMAEIAVHHDDQRQCWLDDDSDQARYHEERRNLALMHLPSNEQGQQEAR